MPEVNFIVQWPDGHHEECYSPSTIIYEYLESDKDYSLDEFMNLAEQALEQASERVREKFGFFCSSAADQLAVIRNRVECLKIESGSGTVMIIYPKN